MIVAEKETREILTKEEIIKIALLERTNERGRFRILTWKKKENIKIGTEIQGETK